MQIANRKRRAHRLGLAGLALISMPQLGCREGSESAPASFLESARLKYIWSTLNLPSRQLNVHSRARILARAPSNSGAFADALLLTDSSIVLLDRDGLLQWLDHQLEVQSTASLSAAFPGESNSPMSLVEKDGNIGVWDAVAASIFWTDFNGAPAGVELLAIPPEGIRDGVTRLLEPYRLHARLKLAGDRRIVEIRSEAGNGDPTATAMLLSVAATRIDTLWQGPVTSYAIRPGGVRLCCDRPPVFGSQLWWDARGDGGILVGTGKSPEMFLLDGSEHSRWLDWGGVRKFVTKGDMLAYFAESWKILRPDLPAAEQRRVAREHKRRFDHFAGFVADSTPVFGQMLVDSRSNTWIRRFDVRVWPDGQSPVWDVYSRTGDYCGDVFTPEVHFAIDIGAQTMLGIKKSRKSAYELLLLAFPQIC